MTLNVTIMRAQPFHNGHAHVILSGVKTNGGTPVILLGSANTPRTIKNPLTFEERKFIINEWWKNQDTGLPIHIFPINDVRYNNDAWVNQVQELISSVEMDYGIDRQVVLVGHSKDKSSFYLKLFPQYASMNVTNFQNIDATNIRNEFMSKGRIYWDNLDPIMDPILPRSTIQFLNNSFDFDWYQKKVKERNDYQKDWGPGPFLATDCVVVQSGHVLMIERKKNPGLLALPGGFVEPGEWLQDAAIRELLEETNISFGRTVSKESVEAILRGSIRDVQTFDQPDRDERARIISQAYYIRLADKVVLPNVVGGDDAKWAGWVPLSELDPQTIFSDHFSIIAFFCKIQ